MSRIQVDDVASLILEKFDMNMKKRDIILKINTSRFQIISKFHPAYFPLQLPLFSNGEYVFFLGTWLVFKTLWKVLLNLSPCFIFCIYNFGQALTKKKSGEARESSNHNKTMKVISTVSCDGYKMIESNLFFFVWLVKETPLQ